MRPFASSSEFTPAERGVLYITCPCHFFSHFFILVFPAVTMPLVAALGIPLERVVRLSFLMYLAYGLGAVPVGMLVDRWQARRVLIAGLFLMGAGLLLAGAFPAPGAMAPALGLVGIGASVYHPAGLALISRTIRRRGAALGLNGVFGNLGIASAPLVTGLLTWAFSWRTALLVLGAAGVLTGVLVSRIRVDETAGRGARSEAADEGGLLRYFFVLCAALVFAGLAYRGNMLLLPAYLELKTSFVADLVRAVPFVKARGTDTLAATALTSLVLLAGIAGQLVGGRLADRMDLRRAYLLVHGASLPFILAMAFTTEYALAVSAALYAFFSLGMQPIENSLIAALTPHRWRSTSFAFKFVLNFGVGSAAVYVVEPIKRAYSLEAVYLFLAAATAALVLTILVLLAATRRIPSIRN